MDMGRLKKPLGTAIDIELTARIDKWIERAQENGPMTKVWVIETALREFLEKREGGGDE